MCAMDVMLLLFLMCDYPIFRQYICWTGYIEWCSSRTTRRNPGRSFMLYNTATCIISSWWKGEGKIYFFDKEKWSVKSNVQFVPRYCDSQKKWSIAISLKWHWNVFSLSIPGRLLRSRRLGIQNWPPALHLNARDYRALPFWTESWCCRICSETSWWLGIKNISTVQPG